MGLNELISVSLRHGSARLSSTPVSLLSNDAAVDATIDLMRIAAITDKDSIEVRAAIGDAFSSLPENVFTDSLFRARAIYQWAKRNVTFRQDESVLAKAGKNQAELLIEPAALLNMVVKQGDCDEFSMLIASMGLLVGLPMWYVAIAADQDRPNEFTHVYCKTVVGDRQVALDGSHGAYFGWEAPKGMVTRRKEWKV